MRRQYFDYRPRPQFRAFHRRKERFACIITHRRAGKTVACIHELQRRAIESTKKHPRFAYLSPLLKSDADLLECALARVTLEDDFGQKLIAREGRVPQDIQLEF